MKNLSPLKPWSVTTTVRNPNRIKGFLTSIKPFNDLPWNHDNQEKFQISLIQNRLYGYNQPQFINNLKNHQINLINNISRKISYQEAEEIFKEKKYEDPPIRGRQSFNPLKKFGFAIIENKKVKITDLGKKLLNDDYEMGKILFISFLKWQIPNSKDKDNRYNVKPFIAALHLINLVNKKESEANRIPKGISKEEFYTFIPTLIHFRDIDSYADKIIALRKMQNNKPKEEKISILKEYKQKFILQFAAGDARKAKKIMKNLSDYGDNAIRYFRLTGYIQIRGNGFYIDLEPRKIVEIESLLANDDAKILEFESKEKYYQYLSDFESYPLPWKNKEKYFEIIKITINEIKNLESELNLSVKQFENFENKNEQELEEYIEQLKSKRKNLQDLKIKQKFKNIDSIEKNILNLKNIYQSENRPILLEKLSTFALHALNDAKKIKPNYPVGDDNEPTFTAPANVPDIECYYENFNAICEVTMLERKDQWFNEGQPVMRHLRDFEDKYCEKECYCLFIAPKIHRDTRNTFWIAVKYEYEGKKQNIIPLKIEYLIRILEFLVDLKKIINLSNIKKSINYIILS